MSKILITVLFKTLIITFTLLQITYWLLYLLYQKYQERKLALAKKDQEFNPLLDIEI